MDATIIQALSSAKNWDKQRDPDMHQTRKGQQWYFGMKAHIGVDVGSGLDFEAVAVGALLLQGAEDTHHLARERCQKVLLPRCLPSGVSTGGTYGQREVSHVRYTGLYLGRHMVRGVVRPCSVAIPES